MAEQLFEDDGQVAIFTEAVFAEGSNESIVQAMFKVKSFGQGTTPMREISLQILESDESIRRLVELVAISKSAGEFLQAEKRAQVAICDWYIETWMKQNPGFCMDDKYRCEISRYNKPLELFSYFIHN